MNISFYNLNWIHRRYEIKRSEIYFENLKIFFFCPSIYLSYYIQYIWCPRKILKGLKAKWFFVEIFCTLKMATKNHISNTDYLFEFRLQNKEVILIDFFCKFLCIVWLSLYVCIFYIFFKWKYCITKINYKVTKKT